VVELALALASQVDMQGHEQLVSDAQTGSQEYLRLLAPLEQMHLAMHEVRGVYTKRIGPDGDMVYVLDTAQSPIPSLRDRATAVTRVGERVLMDTIEPGLVETVLAGKPWLDEESFIEGGVRLRGIYVPLRTADGKVVGMLGVDFEERELRDAARRSGRALALPAMGMLLTVAGLLAGLVWSLRRELGSILGALREETVRDPLTTLFNRRHFAQSLSAHTDLARRTGRALSLLMIDVDRFKSINDALGHAAGDRVLVGVAEALRHCARNEDIVCRVGGEEFALLLPGTDAEQARVLFDRISSVVRRPLDERGDIGLELTVSAGIAALLPGETADALMLRADRALYGAKRAGRDRCEMAPGRGAA
jgi:diguanylate cyclase (GGDEF)-like protein